MKLNDDLVKRLSKVYEPSTMMTIRFRGNDVAFKTDESGNPVLAFVGKMTEDGTIKGERFTRILKYDQNGKRIKDHWDAKGRVN